MPQDSIRQDACDKRNDRSIAAVRPDKLHLLEAGQIESSGQIGEEPQSGRESNLVPDQSQRLRVLIVDDNKDAADSLACLVKLWRYDVEVTYDGLSAVRVAIGYAPDVVLLDLGMPKLDGIEVAKQMLEHAALKHILFIAVSGHTDQTHRTRAAAVGIGYYLIKPVEPLTVQTLLAAQQKVISKPA